MGSEPAPRALFVSRNLPPLTGGMERLNYQAYLALSRELTMAVCGPQGFQTLLPRENIGVEVPPAPLSRFLVTCQLRSWTLARRFRPNFVYSGSGLTAPAALVAARSVGARSVCYLHGLDIIADHPIYRRFFLPAVRRQDRILVNSHHTAELAKGAGVRSDRISLVHPGVELPDLSTTADARNAFRERFSLGERPILLAAGRLTARKGLEPFIRKSLPEIMRRVPDATLVVVGAEASQALRHHRGVLEDIRNASIETGLESRILFLGGVTDELLSQAYFAADLLVFPILDLPGDVEGFGMVALEAAAHGLQTVAFRVGGVPDAVSDGYSGHLIEPGDYQALTRMILNSLSLNRDRDRDRLVQQCLDHARKFSWDIFEKKLCSAVGGKE